MQLMLAKDWIKECTAGDNRPTVRTVREWVRTGELPGQVIGRRIYVDNDAVQKRTGNAVADAIIGAGA